MKEFINYIKEYIPVSKEIEESIYEVAELKSINKGEILLKEGKVCKQTYFFIDGCARNYLFQKGKDITHWIYASNILFTSWGSYVTQKPSTEYLETIDNCRAVVISYNNWQQLYKLHPELERFGRLIIEEQMALIDEFYKGYYFLSAKEKYELLLKGYPNITQIANLGHIASMLGISQETLSRIRGK